MAARVRSLPGGGRGSARSAGRGLRVSGESRQGGIFVHPHGLCESTTVGVGTRVWAFAHVLKGAQIGRDCNICDGVYVEGGVAIGDRVTIKNQVMVFDGVTVEDDVFLGP